MTGVLVWKILMTQQFIFSPELGNVVFASALDGWGFR